MEKRPSSRSSLLRGLGLVAALLISAGAISPAFSAAPLTKAKVKKIAKKVAVKQIKKLAPGLSVAHAATADTLNGVGVLPIKHRSGDVTDQTILDAGGLQLRVSCAGGDEEIRARTTVADGEIAAISDDAFFADASAGGLVHNYDDDFDPGDDFDVQDTATASDDYMIQLQYLGGDGGIVTAHLISDDNLGSSNCIVSGYAVVIG